MRTLHTYAPPLPRAPQPMLRTPEVRTFLPEVQALRALAVMLVVLYHLWPNRLPGGYVGVDVFFVISGFLITSHLHRELLSRGTVSLRAFYARRARRLLPASMLVLLTSALASFVLLPVTRWTATAHEVLASTFYVQNWMLATRAVDYSALDDAASPVQHFWSLSVEEQFYLAWPSLILVLAFIARRRGSGRVDSVLLPGVLVVSALSLGYSVYATWSDPAAAYFVTPTRIWELGAGAALALWMRGRAETAGNRQVPRSALGPILLRWVGIGAVLTSAVLLSSASPFPGYLALIPVLGTMAVIAAGDTGPRDRLGRLVDLRPTQFLGAVSYSLYLWHWPLIVIAPFVVGQPLSWDEKLVLLGLSVALAWLTKVTVEDRSQKWRTLVARPALAAGATALAMAVMSCVALLQLHEVGQREDAARATLAGADGRPCFGAGALAPGSACAEPFGPPVSASLTTDDQPWFADPACTVDAGAVPVSTCRFSAEPPTRRVALVGDSHAEHWRGALHRVAALENWELVEILRGGCPAAGVSVLSFDGNGVDTEGCREWGRWVDEKLAAEQFDYVFTSSYSSAYTFDADPADSLATATEGFRDTWTGWADSGSRVFVLQDIPTTGNRQVHECVALNPDTPGECARARDAAVQQDAARSAYDDVDTGRIHSVDLTDKFCDATTCHAVVGGALVYWDANHMSGQFSRTLAPFVLERVQQEDGAAA